MKNRKLILIILVISIIGNFQVYNYSQLLKIENRIIENCSTSNGSVESPLIYGLYEDDFPSVLDPLNSWDPESNDLIRHICDNLWYYNLSSGPNFALEMQLATSYSWDNTMTNLTVTLREGVYFHDGSIFNATAVKFTFDRILYFINATGTLPNTTMIAEPASLFFDISGNSILNRTVINSDYNVTFVLNKPNGIFINLLTYDACAILHPASTPATSYLELETDILVGTGPFIYNGHLPGEQISLNAYHNYWNGQSSIEEIIFQLFSDSTTANNAMLSNDIHFLGTPLQSYLQQFQQDEDLIVINMNTSNVYRYWGLNNRKINNTNVRKAIAYAYNYTYYIEVIREGYHIRAHQMLPPGFPYHNSSFTAPYYDTAIARQAMLDACAELGGVAAGYNTTNLTAEAVGVNLTNDANWYAKTFFTYKVLEHEGWTRGQDMNYALANDLKTIGINLVPDIMDWETYVDTVANNKDRLEIFHDGWGIDYIEPFNMVKSVLNNMSGTNRIQLQDSQIMTWLQEYEETDPADTTARAELLYKIQNRAINELYCQLPVSNDMFFFVHHENLTSFPYNIMNFIDFYSCDGYFPVPGPDYPPTSNHPEDLVTYLGSSETIDWMLYDDEGGGQYRVWVNDTNGDNYVWVNWTPWINNTVLNIPINSTTIGIFNYTIEYNDNNNQFGNVDTVLVTISDMIPTSNHPQDLVTYLGSSETIDWILYDDEGGGQYRVLVNDTNGNYYIWVNWTPWTKNTVLNVPINMTTMGIFYYTIEYYDNNNQSGNPDTVIVSIVEESIPGLNFFLISTILLFAIIFYVYKIQRKKD